MQSKYNLVIYGAGAIGTTLAVWLTCHGHRVSLLARPKRAQQLANKRFTVTDNKKATSETANLTIIDQLDPNQPIDCLIVTVKNFDLEQACQDITGMIGNKTLVLGLQNGIFNQQVLPRYFGHVIYGIANYNAWQSKPAAQTQGLDWQVNINGPLILGGADKQLAQQTQHLTKLFSDFIPCVHSSQFQDDAHAKLVANLANAVTTITGNAHHQPCALTPLQRILTRVVYEGIQTIKAAGFSEPKTSPLPSWAYIRLSIYVPALFTRSTFRKKLALIGSTSMASDILSRGSCVSELTSINGYLLNLANQHQLSIPYNERLYALCQQRFGQRPFVPVTAQQLSDYLHGQPI
jgi:2-dehydropantoate 2-reductase